MIRTLLYGKKRRDRWWRYLTLRDAFLKAQAQAEPAKALADASRRLGYGDPGPNLLQRWCDLVQLGAGRSSSLSHDAEKAAIAGVQSMDHSELSVLAWLDFFHLGLGIGLYHLADSFREKGIERAVLAAKTPDPRRDEIILGFYGNLEKGDYQAAARLVEQFEVAGCTQLQIDQARWLLNLFSTPLQGQSQKFGPPALAEDRRFGQFIEGKSVALVGPAPTEAESGPEIDRQDVVVKFSYRGGDKGRDPATQGRRLDVSYYNNTQAQALARGNFREVLADIEWGVCINRKGRSRFPMQLDNMRQIASLQWLLPDTHFNAGPNAVIDLLRFNPGIIRIFNTDLMLSAGRYAGYRPAGAKPIEYTRSFIKTHDPVLQFKTMHRLWELGYIVGDQRFEEVMGLGLNEYLAQLQKVHGANEQALL